MSGDIGIHEETIVFYDKTMTETKTVLLNMKGINKLNSLIDWELFREELEAIQGYQCRDDSKGGRPPFEPVFMFKVLILQKY